MFFVHLNFILLEEQPSIRLAKLEGLSKIICDLFLYKFH